MEMNELFVASVRPVNLNRIMKAPKVDSQVYIRRNGGSYELSIWHSPAKVVKAVDESDLWHQVACVEEEDILKLLSESTFVTHRACARRAQMLMSSVGQMDALNSLLQERIATIQATVIESLGATRVTRAKPVARLATPSKNASYWTISSNVHVPYIPDVVFMTTKVLPSVLDPQAWSMFVTMDAPSNEALDRNQRGLDVARARLADLGIVIKDTVSGTPLAYL